jgi:hypothetical protein
VVSWGLGVKDATAKKFNNVAMMFQIVVMAQDSRTMRIKVAPVARVRSSPMLSPLL